MEDRCKICGSLIGENNPDGLGAECRKALNQAKLKAAFRNVEGFSLKYNYLIGVEVTKKTFLNLYRDTKFRSEFHKSFYQSMQNAERISKKQLQIMQDRIMQKDGVVYEEMFNTIRDKKQRMLKEVLKDITVTREEIEIERQLIRKV